MGRISRPDNRVPQDEVRARILAGEEVPVTNRAYGPDLKVRCLKAVNRAAYDEHMVQLSIGDAKVVVNLENLRESLRYA